MTTIQTIRRTVLEGLFEALNSHDADAVMACMTDDIVFDAAAGLDVHGRRFSGTADVRAAFEGVWTNMPDVSWQRTRHATFGNRGVSEWIFLATTKDGQLIEVEGCDFFVFRGEKICMKSAFRKDRPPQPVTSG
jgi:ketosteroid isomerase-like protein